MTDALLAALQKIADLPLNSDADVLRDTVQDARQIAAQAVAAHKKAVRDNPLATVWRATPEEAEHGRPLSGEYRVTVAFVRNLDDDLDVLDRKGGEAPDYPGLVRQLVAEIQPAFDAGAAGRFQCLDLAFPKADARRR